MRITDEEMKRAYPQLTKSTLMVLAGDRIWTRDAGGWRRLSNRPIPIVGGQPDYAAAAA